MMIRMIVLFALTVLLLGCSKPILTGSKQRYTCEYKNITTHKIYVGTSRSRINAVKKAMKLCRKGDVEWNCYFQTCSPD